MPDTSEMSQAELDVWSDINNPNNDADMDDWADCHNPNNDSYLGDDQTLSSVTKRSFCFKGVVFTTPFYCTEIQRQSPKAGHSMYRFAAIFTAQCHPYY